MTTQSWLFTVDHTSDAGFRLWGLDFAAKLAAAGLVQTADTGQINWASVTRAGTNADAGYEIWRFNDTQQGAAPIFIKFYYGTRGAASNPRIRWELGTGSNGSGTITGTAKTAVEHPLAGPQLSGDGVTARQSYMCGGDGWFWFVWFTTTSPGTNSMANLAVFRTADASGVPDAVGAHLMWSESAGPFPNSQSLRFAATAAAYIKQTAAATPCCFIVGQEAATLVGGVPQVFPILGLNPRVFPVFGAGVTKTTEIADLATYTWTPYGATSHTYINMNQRFNTQWVGTLAVASYGLGLIWE